MKSSFRSWDHPDFLVVEKRLDKKAMANFKIYDVADWTTDNYNTHVTQYLKTQRQSGNAIWSVSKVGYAEDTTTLTFLLFTPLF